MIENYLQAKSLADNRPSYGSPPLEGQEAAFVYATLAVADGLRAIAEKLDELETHLNLLAERCQR
jgi:hypothetical protein